MLSEILQVRGTPSSGESMLAKLLGRHIQDQEPDVRVIWIGEWNLDDVAECGGWYSYLQARKGWIPGENMVFIFDRAHTTGNSGTSCSKAYTTILIVVPLLLRVMAVHLCSST